MSGPSSFDSTCSDQNDPCCHCSDIRTDSFCPYSCLPTTLQKGSMQGASAEQQQADSGAFWMGQCQKTDRPSCILEVWFPELFPGMKIQHRPSQISTLVSRHVHGSLESTVAPPVSLAFMLLPYSSSFSKTPGPSVGLWIHASLMQSCRIVQEPRRELRSPQLSWCTLGVGTERQGGVAMNIQYMYVSPLQLQLWQDPQGPRCFPALPRLLFQQLLTPPKTVIKGIWHIVLV